MNDLQVCGEQESPGPIKRCFSITNAIWMSKESTTTEEQYV